MNIGENSTIYYMEQNKIMTNIINVIFTLEGKSNIIFATPNMLFKELILKYCQIIRYPYKEMKYNYFMYNSQNIQGKDFLSLNNIGIKNNSRI